VSADLELYAHSANESGQWHSLRAHLTAVAELASQFGTKFGASDPAFWAGLWHDIGKAHPQFQTYLRDPRTRRGPDHKAAGALVAGESKLEPLAFLIQGHHGGLASKCELQSWLEEKSRCPEPREALEIARRLIPGLTPDSPPPWPAAARDPSGCELFLRMLFSALVDADFLDTERHANPEKSARREPPPSLESLWSAFEPNQAALTGRETDAVNSLRHSAYLACLAAATQPQGFFRLTVPTGGGKTRSALAFALRHALHHRLDRVIFAIPYTSIIEQTGNEYRNIFGPGVVLEHHTGIAEADPDDPTPEELWVRLGAENWDARIVVTTTVQLFESLFSNHPSRCRKLHNLANSVLILDEAQMLPTRLLDPILEALKLLVRDYGVTVVLSTATQPALDRQAYTKGLPGVRHIVADSRQLFSALRRVRYHIPTPGQEITWDELTKQIRACPQALAIVNTKPDALRLLDALADPDAFHLSTLLCGAHRRDALDEIKTRLKARLPCRVVSTQVVEAGVDLDFPAVFRALAPLDRIVQAAGRCNREGSLPDLGQVFLFEPAGGGSPPGHYRTGTEIARVLLAAPGFDFDDPAVYREYFRRLFAAVETDAQGILKLRETFNYPTVARRFRMIEDRTVPVVVRYRDRAGLHEKVDGWLEALRARSGSPRVLLRKLQPFLVPIRASLLNSAEREGLISPVVEGLWEWLGGYDTRRGLATEHVDPAQFVV
jgi:CRISPR-associated endonuclease/helicase Cas3